MIDELVREERDVPTSEDFRRACAGFPTGVAVVTASVGGELHGSTVNAFTSLTLDPPQVLLCLADTSRTWSAIERSRRFAVNLLASDQEDVARLFASKAPDKFGGLGWSAGATGAPLLAGAVGAFECELADATRNHSHWIVVGRVVGLSADQARDPLLFVRGRLTT